MATFKAEIQNKRSDGTYNVRIRITHNRSVRRISTNLFVSGSDITRSLKIKNQQVLGQCDELIKKCRDACNQFGYEINNVSIDQLLDKIKTQLKGGEKFNLDFFSYANEKTKSMTPGSARNYQSMLNALKRFLKRDKLDIAEINTVFLKEFEQFIIKEPAQGGSNSKLESREVKAKKGRAESAYLASIRAIHNLAKAEYNDEDRGIILIPYSPFRNFKIKPQPKTKKRAISIEAIQKIIDLPYQTEFYSGKKNRFNLAKDCFLISFGLIGMNSADLYHCDKPKKDVIIYNRRKTSSRRSDDAEMRVKVPEVIKAIIKKYQDGEKLFCFHKLYADTGNFNKAINLGLKEIGKLIDEEDLQFYAARHSWATIARSAKVGIDKATVHEALNHADAEMKVTDIYIDRDWSIVWDANEKILNLFSWNYK